MPQPQPGPVLSHSPRVSQDYADLVTPGVVIEVTAEDAESLGAFEETALSAGDAWTANADVEAA